MGVQSNSMNRKIWNVIRQPLNINTENIVETFPVLTATYSPLTELAVKIIIATREVTVRWSDIYMYKNLRKSLQLF